MPSSLLVLLTYTRTISLHYHFDKALVLQSLCFPARTLSLSHCHLIFTGHWNPPVVRPLHQTPLHGNFPDSRVSHIIFRDSASFAAIPTQKRARAWAPVCMCSINVCIWQSIHISDWLCHSMYVWWCTAKHLVTLLHLGLSACCSQWGLRVYSMCLILPSSTPVVSTFID